MASEETLSIPRRATGAWVLAGFVVAVVGMMIVPIPTWLLDALLTFNLALSVALLLAAVYSARTLELSTFPTLLVLTTLFRLALNVSSVRLILLQANAGRVIHAFGAFVVRGEYVVGFAVFLILTIVQYVVIARGAERVAEVAARFTLDALPGQQLAIDSELRAGTLSADDARARRASLGREAQLYGSLDGAMRFVKGDAIAGILILLISLVGGLTIGVVQHGMEISQAARLYTLLTIGDGLVSQLPALLISTAAGLVVTRVASDQAGESLERDLFRQLLRPRALLVTAGLLAALALTPGLPLWPFAVVALGVGFLAQRIRQRPQKDERDEMALPRVPSPLEVALDPQLRAASPELPERIERTRLAVVDDLGLPLPRTSLVTDARLPLRSYEVRLRGVPIAAGRVPDGRLLADVGPASLPPDVEAQAAEHPQTHALASWVPASAAPRLKAAGVQLLDGTDCVAASLDAALRDAAPELLGLDETQRLLDETARVQPALVREVVPKRVDVPTLAEILRRLVAESLSIGDLRDVLEAIARLPPGERDAAQMTERVRAQMSRQISHRHARERRVSALELDAEAEEAVRGALRPSESGPLLALEPDLQEALLVAVKRELEALGEGRSQAVLLAPPELRRHVRRLVAREHPRLPVLAYSELGSDVQVDRVGTIGLF